MINWYFYYKHHNYIREGISVRIAKYFSFKKIVAQLYSNVHIACIDYIVLGLLLQIAALDALALKYRGTT